MVVSSIAWAKLAVLARGAGLASEKLWGKLDQPGKIT
jgi:hypothetical protein